MSPKWTKSSDEPLGALGGASSVSIVIPALNEATSLPTTLRHLRALSPAPLDVVVVDGGSRDDTVMIARAEGARVVVSDLRSRAAQMNAGAGVARGEVLLFLHADTWLPPDALALATEALSDEETALVGFVSIMCGPQRTRWATSFHNFVKTWYAPLLFRPWRFSRHGLRLLFGDQVMVCRRADFEACGGFDVDKHVMEDAWLCERLNRRGRVRMLRRCVFSSDRRVARWGFIGAHARYLWLGLLWGLRVTPGASVRKMYDDAR